MPAKRIPVFAFLNKYEKGRSATNEITGVGGAGLLSICPTPTKKTKKNKLVFVKLYCISPKRCCYYLK